MRVVFYENATKTPKRVVYIADGEVGTKTIQPGGVIRLHKLTSFKIVSTETVE